MPKLDDLKKELLPLVRKEACLRLPEPIKLSSGKMSDVYFDGRKVTLHPKGMTLFARAILEVVKLDSLDAVGGPSIGADPIATAVSIFALLDKKAWLFGGSLVVPLFHRHMPWPSRCNYPPSQYTHPKVYRPLQGPIRPNDALFD